MTFWSVAAFLLHWMSQHPGEVVMVLGAIASLVDGWLVKWPFLQKVARILSALGINVPALKDIIVKVEPTVVAAAEKIAEEKASH